MSDDFTINEAGAIMAGHGMDAEAGSRRYRKWREFGIIPDPARFAKDGQGRGRPAACWPQAHGAVFALVSDLFDAGACTGRDNLANAWEWLTEQPTPQSDTRIEALLAAAANGEESWIVFTLWRHEITGHVQPTMAVRHEQNHAMPICAPAPDFEPIGDYVRPVSDLLRRFAVHEGNVVSLALAKQREPVE